MTLAEIVNRKVLAIDDIYTISGELLHLDPNGRFTINVFSHKGNAMIALADEDVREITPARPDVDTDIEFIIHLKGK